MVADKEKFDVSGPVHLRNSWDWYLYRVLDDDNDSSYFGAIYELQDAHQYAPKYVIAFRGTIKRFQNLYQDMKLNFKFVYGHPEESPRFNKAYEAVLNTVDLAGAANVWLAGHSLGASIAMLAGRKLAKCELYLETYLFNPPFNSVPIENLIKNRTLKHVVRIWASLMKAGIAIIMKRPSEDLEEDAFIMLSEWKPNMFVNPKDPICSEYIGYFQHRDNMNEIGKTLSPMSDPTTRRKWRPSWCFHLSLRTLTFKGFQKSSLTGMTADVYCHLTYSNEKMGFFEISLVPGAMSDEKNTGEMAVHISSRPYHWRFLT
ncbi:hypothetical protein E3N88_23488 [Mikania micrantha]|uniref:Fungal lipase-type domain-containing protein n=1 Tax=Mikania micrantha TaxID=192012 RepID=A0A5N6NFD4_9ASTR|nr:hypothetical protein E3N88_23488 [Mikania micrantha]